MAERDALLHSTKYRPCCLPKKVFGSFCVPFKGAILVLVWSALIHSPGTNRIILVMSEQLNYLTISSSTTANMVISSALLITFLLYPAAGILAETRFTRFKFLVGGTIVSIIGISTLIVTAASLTFDENILVVSSHLQHSTLATIMLVIGLITYRVGLGMFEANVIQFGVDQLQFASNEELSKFVHWYYWTMCAVQFTLTSIIPVIPFSQIFIRLYWVRLFLPQTVFSLLCCLLSLLLVGIAYKGKYLLIEPTSRNSPVTLIWGVMKYISHHSQPVRRSAFTYGDPLPSRLDIAKERYGGPFTTEQVEDVKSFWRIAVLLLTLFGVSVTSDYDNIAQIFFNYPIVANKLNKFSIFYWATLFSSGAVYYAVIIIGIPIYMCLVRPCLYPWLPSMLKRMGIGLLFLCIQLCLYGVSKGLILRAYTNINVSCIHTDSQTEEPVLQSDLERDFSFGLVLMAQIFYGLGIATVFLTSLEFILAQAPRTMQGLLIGLWYAYQSLGVVSYMISILPIVSVQCHYWLYTVKTLLSFISLLLYIIVARQFKYRQREEPSNINYRSVIEEYTQRQLDKEKTLQYSYSTTDEYIINDD